MSSEGAHPDAPSAFRGPFPARELSRSLDRSTALGARLLRAGHSEVLDARRTQRAAVSRRRRCALPPTISLSPVAAAQASQWQTDPKDLPADMVHLSSNRPRETFPPRRTFSRWQLSLPPCTQREHQSHGDEPN